MGKIVSNFFISLDGVVESPDRWHFPYFNDEMGTAIGAGMKTSAAFLMGRVLYDEWSQYWPQRQPDGPGTDGEPATADPFAEFINPLRKYVLSSTLTEARWTNTKIISGDVEREVARVKAETDDDIMMSGSATTVRWLLDHGLLDELHLLVHPIIVGNGQRLFIKGPTHPLRLIDNTTFSTGVLHLVYAPDKAA